MNSKNIYAVMSSASFGALAGALTGSIGASLLVAIGVVSVLATLDHIVNP